MSTQTATREHGAIESAQMERVDGGAGHKLYDIRVGGKLVGSVGTYDRVKVRGEGTVIRWRVVRASIPGVSSIDRPSRVDAIAHLLTWLGYDEDDAKAVAPRIALY